MPEPPAHPADAVKKTAKGIKHLPKWALILGGIAGIALALYLLQMQRARKTDEESAIDVEADGYTAEDLSGEDVGSYDPAGVTIPQNYEGLPSSLPTTYSGNLFGVGTDDADNILPPPAGPSAVAGDILPGAITINVPRTGGGPPHRPKHHHGPHTKQHKDNAKKHHRKAAHRHRKHHARG